MIRLGDVDEEQDNECNDDGFCLQEEDFEIDKIIVHPNYNNPRYANDIALIRLKQSTAASSKFIDLFIIDDSIECFCLQTRSARFACPLDSSKQHRMPSHQAGMESSPDGVREVESRKHKAPCCSGSDCLSSTPRNVRRFTRTTLRASGRAS